MGAASIEKSAKAKPRADTRWFRITEKILYTYPTLDAAIRVQKALISSIDQNQLPSGTAKYGDLSGSPSTGEKLTEPEAYAERRIKSANRVDARVKLLQARKVAVDGALARLDENSRRLVELWYFADWQRQKKPGNRAIWKELGISRNTFGRRRAAVVEEVARWLGELTEIDI